MRVGLSKLVNTEVCSTEELCYHIGQYNKLVKQANQSIRIQPQRGNKAVPIQGGSLVIGSMDVAALYPNCKVKGTMLAIEEGTKLSGMNYEQVNKGFLTKFVSITTKGKSGNPRIDEFLQTPKPRTTLASWMKRKSETQFLGPPKRTVGELTPQDLRVMLGLASSRSTRHVMMNHFFSINGQIYRQRDGSPIGMDLSVEGASLYNLVGQEIHEKAENTWDQLRAIQTICR